MTLAEIEPWFILLYFLAPRFCAVKVESQAPQAITAAEPRLSILIPTE